MPNLRIENIMSDDAPNFCYKIDRGNNVIENNCIAPKGNVDINNYDYDFASTFYIERREGNAILFTYKNFTHGIEIIDSNSMIVRIYPVNSTTDDLVIKAQNYDKIPSGAPPAAIAFPEKITLKHSFNSPISFEIMLNSEDVSIINHPKDTIWERDLGEEGVGKIQIITSNIGNHHWEIDSNGYPVALLLEDHNDESFVKIKPSIQPQNINISIVPD